MLNRRIDDQQQPRLPDPGDVALKYVKALAYTFGIALGVIAVIGHFDWVRDNGLWVIPAVISGVVVVSQWPRILKHVGDFLDRRAKRKREDEVNTAQARHLDAKSEELRASAQIKAAQAWQTANTLPFDERGNLVWFDHVSRQVSQLTGQAPEFPHLTTYHNAPRVTGIREETPEQQQLAPPKAIVPTGRELLMSGAVERALADGRLLLGPQDDGTMETLPIKRCFSTLISGLPYTGKTTSVFWIAGQLVIIGARIWIVDPHMHYQDEEGNRSLAAELDALGDSFVFEPCDDDPRAVIPRVRWMYKELCKRQEPGFIVRAQDTIIGIMDEFNTVADSIDPSFTIVQHKQRPLNFAETLALLEREGRKFGLHFMLIGHKWAQQDIGGDNAVRTNAATYICHKLNDQRQANLLLGGGYGKRMLELSVGEYLITGSAWNKPVTKITTPMISAVDLPLLRQIKERGVQVRNQGNVIESTALPDLPMKKSRATESLEEFGDEAWGGAGAGQQEESDDPSIIPLRPQEGQRRAEIADAIEVWNEVQDPNMGRPRMMKELRARGLSCSGYWAEVLLAQIRQQLNDQQAQAE